MRFSRKVTIFRVKRPQEADINTDLLYFGSSLGLFGLRDKDKSCYRIFVELLKAAKFEEGLTSDRLAFKLDLSRGTVVHHLNKLLEAGIAINVKNKYYLRDENLEVVVQNIKKDLERQMDELGKIATDIDKWIGL